MFDEKWAKDMDRLREENKEFEQVLDFYQNHCTHSVYVNKYQK